MYAGGNRGRFPDSIASLYSTSDLTAVMFVCPSTTDRVATGATPQSIGQRLAASPPPNAPGACCSYVYVGAGLTDQSPRTAVAMYEPISNHRDGSHVVYADGHIKWHDAKSLAKIIAALNAGQNPPP